MKIVDLDGYAANPGDISWDGVKELGEFVFYDYSEEHQIIERAKDAEIVLVNKINMTREIIEQLPKLKYIGELATGYNNIDLQAAKDHGVIVTNIPAYSTDSVTQFVFARTPLRTCRQDAGYSRIGQHWCKGCMGRTHVRYGHFSLYEQKQQRPTRVDSQDHTGRTLSYR